MAILVRRIEVHVIPFVSEMLSGNYDAACPVKILDRRLLPPRAPSRPNPLWHFSKLTDGMRPGVSPFQKASAQEAQLAVIEIVSVKVAQQHAGRAGAHEPVQRLFEKCCGRGKTHPGCQIPPQP